MYCRGDACCALAASRIRQKVRQGVQTRFRWILYHHALDDVCVPMPQDLPAENAVWRFFARMAADRTSSHKRPLTSCSATISSTHDACSKITTRPTTSLPSRHPSRPATQGNLSAVTVLNLLQKCVVHFCSQVNIVTGASAAPRHTPPVLLLRFR